MQFDLVKVLQDTKDQNLVERIRKDCIHSESGHLVYWPENKYPGYLDEYSLILIAAILHDANKEWDKEINAALN